MTTGRHPRTAPPQPQATIADARRRREETAALTAQARQAVRHATALLTQGNAILESAVAITEMVLSRRRIALAAPVAARFNTDEFGSTGIELVVELADPTAVPIAERAIRERFGGEGRADRVVVM